MKTFLIKGFIVAIVVFTIGYTTGCHKEAAPKITGDGWTYDPEIKPIVINDKVVNLSTLTIDFSQLVQDSCDCPPNSAAAYADYEDGLYDNCEFCFIVDHSLNNCNTGKIQRILNDLQMAGITVSLDSVRGMAKETTGERRIVWQDNDVFDGCISVNHEIHESFPEYGSVYDNGTFKFILWDQVNNVQIVNEAHLDNLLYLSFSYY